MGLMIKWHVVDSPLTSPPLNNKGPILLSNQGESEEDCEVVGRKRRMAELAECENHNKSKIKNEEESNDEESCEEVSDYEECKCS